MLGLRDWKRSCDVGFVGGGGAGSREGGKRGESKLCFIAKVLIWHWRSNVLGLALPAGLAYFKERAEGKQYTY